MMSPEYIDPVKDIGSLLLGVEKPDRYTGGEYGRLASRDAVFRMLIAFPDLYEIGMSNQALRIIYNGLNRIPGISCDRAFAPAPDFERLLHDRGLPLYGLDTGISLKRLDLLLFTLGYELGISGILSTLDVSGIPLRSDLRGEDDPVIIAGGPAVSNPLPYSPFIDAFWIGEAEAGFFDLAKELLQIKKSFLNNASSHSSFLIPHSSFRSAVLERLRKHPHVWMPGKEKAVRAVYPHFSAPDVSQPSVFPIASLKTVQHHGILEIMRGCPNGCRFCHAGYWYRPMRQKSPETLIREADAFISSGGYREISLSSLSSGDYSGIGELVDALNQRFSDRRVSFQLPSLRVSTFSLPLLEKISRTRKSGLTFAVETPLDFWQLAINKQVTEDSVAEILREAKRNGWRGAKFYFMIGLPVPAMPEAGNFSEEAEIVNFVSSVARKTAMHFNVNVGIFVPKPHTPYQWAGQIDGETAAAKLDFIRSRLKSQGHKVSISDPLISRIEGILSRGDERAAALIESAFHAGSRLDAWQEFIAKDAWRDLLNSNTDLAQGFLAARNPDDPLPWKGIVSGVSPAYLRKEFEKSGRGELTPVCTVTHDGEQCIAPCGSCNNSTGITRSAGKLPPASSSFLIPHSSLPLTQRLLFSFSKEGCAVFHGHLTLIEIFSMAFNRAGLAVMYTQGFNPLPKLEIVAPLSVGMSAGAEMAAVDVPGELDSGEFLRKVNAALPDGIRVHTAEMYCIAAGAKKHSLSSLLWGFGYVAEDGGTEYVPVSEEKSYRRQRLGDRETVFSLRRTCVLAKNIITNEPQQPWAPYFDVYRYLYPQR